MHAFDKRRCLLLVALVFTLGIVIPRVTGARHRAPAHLSHLSTPPPARAGEATGDGALSPAERAALPGLAPLPAPPPEIAPERDLAFAG